MAVTLGLCSMCGPRGVSVDKVCPNCRSCIHICRGANANRCEHPLCQHCGERLHRYTARECDGSPTVLGGWVTDDNDWKCQPVSSGVRQHEPAPLLIRDSHGDMVRPVDAVRSWLSVSDYYRAENGDDLDEHELWALRDLADCVHVMLAETET